MVILLQSSQDGNLVKYFDEKKVKCDCTGRTFRQFLFGRSPDVQQSRSFTPNQNSKLLVRIRMNISNRHSKSNFAHSFDLH